MDSGEQIVSTTEDSNSDHQDLKSGYFWDHVVGVKRQAFGGRKGMDDYVEGRDERKVTFSSDDLPVDEEIRVGMSSIRVVEDALLVKSGNGESDGRLREGWANWYEVKGKFLKQDKMLARSFEVFNPMNHPLLQDPDIPHGISLTKGDRLFRKKMWNELEKVSFGGDVKRVERRALTAGEGEKDISERMRGRSELKEEHHVYADGKRWGYYPGIQANLSFSEFMDKFLGDEHCGIRVFMVWNSPSWSYGVRQHRGLESLFRHHRDACVVVFSEKMELNFFSDLVKDGFKVALAMPNLDELLKDTPVNIFASLWNDWRKTKHYPIHYSELIRLAALYKYGGIYLDSDVIVLKPLTLDGNFIGMESKYSENSTLNGALMAFEKNSFFIMECMKELYSTYNDTSLSWNGAELLNRVFNTLYGGKNHSKVKLNLKMEEPHIFFPISAHNITRYFTTAVDDLERKQQDVFLKEILDHSIAFHFWNGLTSALIPEPGSLVERLINHHCLYCLDIL